MEKKKTRVYIDDKNIKILAIDTGSGVHREIPFNYRVLNEYNKKGFEIYATNDEGIFFFTNNRAEDGNDWTLITKDTNNYG